MTAYQTNKTVPTEVSIDQFLAGLTEKRREESRVLIALMQKISAEDPVLWGPSIIGFGKRHYRYETGREGVVPRISFSPRKAAISLYFSGFEHLAAQLGRLGKHKLGVGCLYIAHLKDIDLKVLREMLQISWRQDHTPLQRAGSVEEYLQNLPAAAKPQFDRLRAFVSGLLPNAQELLSYGIIGYKTDAHRAKLFISGFKDHVAIYPVPADPAIRERIKPFIHGKGSIWFSLDEPLPLELIRQIVEALI